MSGCFVIPPGEEFASAYMYSACIWWTTSRVWPHDTATLFY